MTKEERIQVLVKALDNMPENVKSTYLKNFMRSEFKDDSDFEAYINGINGVKKAVPPSKEEIDEFAKILNL
ncbi:hypothetical protein EZS27_028439 [termite gut metagenome]|uniref:Uncharacterized protein n=1 Tax=termite gut metagenome TaxID=433724 RepID=A0A5J4QJD1_9ZZZZ